MEKKKLGLEDFLSAVAPQDLEAVQALHALFTEHGCKMDVKEAKSGYVVSYLLGKRTVANFIFRKKGLLIRIYAGHIQDYMEFLDTLPEGMAKAVQDAPVCKRLINPESCNSKCPMGYAFLMKGEPYQKCRYSAFQFLLCAENNPAILTFLTKELA